MASVAHPSDEWLLTRYRSRGDRQARERLTARLMPLAEHVARQYRYPRHEADLLQAAAYGLAKAIEGWDEGHGRTLRTYAVPTMHGEVKRWLRDNAWPVHIPRTMRERATAVRHATQQLTASSGSAPTVGQIAAELGLDEEEVMEARLVAGLFGTLSFDMPVASSDGRLRLEDVLGEVDPRLTRADEMAQLSGLRRFLDERERVMLGLRFVEDLTQSEIAARMGCSQMQVSRVLRDALQRLRYVAERART